MKRSTFTSCFIALFMIFLGANSASAQANCSPTCNDAVQASFDNYCQVPLTYDMFLEDGDNPCLLYTSPSPRDRTRSRMPSSA